MYDFANWPYANVTSREAKLQYLINCQLMNTIAAVNLFRVNRHHGSGKYLRIRAVVCIKLFTISLIRK